MIQQTSMFALTSIKDLTGKRLMVFRAIEELGVACNQDIAQHLEWEINRVTGRVMELREKGVVKECKKAIGPTGRMVIYWEPNYGET